MIEHNSHLPALTPRMEEVLACMFYGEEMGLVDPTTAIAEAEGTTRSAVAAVQRHLARRGYLARKGELYLLTGQARQWQEARA